MKRPPRNRQDKPRNSSGHGAPDGQRKRGPRARKQAQFDPKAPLWLWGAHPVAAALSNPRRQVERLVMTENANRRIEVDGPVPDILSAPEIDALLPAGAVHQGIAARVQPLKPMALEELSVGVPSPLIVLDQVEDPHNLGAIFRSAAAFGAGGIVLQTRHAPPISGTVMKSAAGAVDTVPECRVVNIARALETLKSAGYMVIGLAGGGSVPLADALENAAPVALVLGAEGAGLRPAVAKACDRLAHIPIAPAMESLNVSNAAAIALHEAARLHATGPFSPN